MQSGMSMHDSIASIIMHIMGISSSIIVSWLCLHSQFSINSFGLWSRFLQDSYAVLVYANNILCNLCVSFAIHHFGRVPPAVCGLSSFWLNRWSSNSWILLGHGLCPGFNFLCCYKGLLHWLGSCLQMLLVTVLHCQVLHSLGTAFCPSLAED